MHMPSCLAVNGKCNRISRSCLYERKSYVLVVISNRFSLVKAVSYFSVDDYRIFYSVKLIVEWIRHAQRLQCIRDTFITECTGEFF